jgi:RimJ/RimL family protein N-acetyltransferase
MWRGDDFEEFARICADEEVMRYIGGKVYSRLEAWRHMAYHVGHWHLLGFGHWAVEEKASGRFIGRMGFLHPEGWPGFEVGWTLARESWGRGYATEGARKMLEYAFTEMNRDHVISLIHPENKGSIRVAEKMGETVEGRTEVLGIPVLIYDISRDAWRGNR